MSSTELLMAVIDPWPGRTFRPGRTFGTLVA